MGAVSQLYTFVAGAVPTASQFNSDPAQIYTLLSGQIDKANVDSSGTDGICTLDEAQTITGAKTLTGATVINGGTVFNEAGADVDLRAEGDTNANVINLDGGQDALSFGGANVDGAAATFNNLTERTAVTSVGQQVHIPAQTQNFDNSSSTIAVGAANFIGIPTMTGDNATLTMTKAATLYVQGAPVAGSNVTHTTAGYSLWVDAGATQLDGSVTAGGVLSVDDTTNSTSTTTGSIHTDGGIGWVGDAYVGDDMFFTSAAVLNFAAGDVTVTHSSGTLTVAGNVVATDLDGIIGSNTAAAGTFTTVNFSSSVVAANAAGPSVVNEAATTTNPTLIPNKAEDDTGIGWESDTIVFVAGGAEIGRFEGDTGRFALGVSAGNAIFNVSGSYDDSLCGYFNNTTDTQPYGLWVRFGGAAPDDTTRFFFKGQDTAGAKIYIYSDGDLANHDGTYGTISDIKFKQDIVDARSYWDDFKSLEYKKWKDKGDVVAYGSDAQFRIGLVAQDVEKIFPGCVPETEETDQTESFKWVKSSIIEGPILATVVQELQARVEALEA